MMKVVMVIERYLPIWGGAENQLRQLMPHQREQGCSLRVVTRRWHSDMRKRDVIDGVPVVRLGIQGDSFLATVIFTLHLLVHLSWAGRNDDVFHSHGAVKMGVLCRIASLITGSKTVVKIATAGKVTQIQNGTFGRVFFHLFKQSDTIVCLSGEILDELRKVSFPEQKIARIPNAVDCVRFHKVHDDEGRKEFREKLGIPGNSTVVLFTGRLVQRKGIDTLLDAWGDYVKSWPQSHLLIIGSGKDQPDSVESIIKEQVREGKVDNVLFLGETDKPEHYLAHGDIFVFPSRQEGFPNALMEAMASELPVIATRIGGNEDLIDDRVNGLLFEPDDAGALVEKLEKLSIDKEEAIRLGQSARNHMENCYDFPQISARYKDLYAQLTTKHQSQS